MLGDEILILYTLVGEAMSCEFPFKESTTKKLTTDRT
jgi:hypothetical protein